MSFTTKYILIPLLILPLVSLGQNDASVQRAELGINGLTCSMCAKTVEEALLKLAFVQSVAMDLAGTKATITFNPLSSEISPQSIARAVEHAGFSVRSLAFTVRMGEQPDGCFPLAGQVYRFVGGNQKKQSDGTITFLILNRDFLTSKAYKPWAEKIASTAACTPSGAKKELVFWVASDF